MISRDEPCGVMTIGAGDASMNGEVRRAGELYVTFIDGSPVGGPTGLEFAIYRLTTNVRIALPPVAPGGWEVVVVCKCGGGFTVAFHDSDLRFEADDEWREEIWSALEGLPRHTLSDAIESASVLLRRCLREPSAERTIELPRYEGI